MINDTLFGVRITAYPPVGSAVVGNDGGYNHMEVYQWTPTHVNQPYFGVTIDVYPPIGSGTVVVCYDLEEITVVYSQP